MDQDLNQRREEKLRKRFRRQVELYEIREAQDKEKRLKRFYEEREKNPDKFKHKSKPDPVEIAILGERLYPHNIDYVQIPMEIMMGPFSKAEMLLWGYIRVFSKNHGCYQTNEGIAKYLDLSEGTIKRAIKRLLDFGLITWEVYPDEDKRRKYYHMKKKPPSSGRTLKIIEREKWKVLKRFNKDETLENQSLNSTGFYERLEDD